MTKRFKKDYSVDGWPILDTENHAALSTDDAIMLLNKYAARIQELESPSSEQIPDILFDGLAVYKAVRHGPNQRTSPENVSDVLDAVVRLWKPTKASLDSQPQRRTKLALKDWSIERGNNGRIVVMHDGGSGVSLSSDSGGIAETLFHRMMDQALPEE